MGFVKTKEELDYYFNLSTREFTDAQILGILYETEPEIIEKVLPPPLTPTPEPWALSFISHYPVTNLGPGYHESALFVRCQYNGEIGNYCLSMPIDDEARMHNGRDIYGFPKKLAHITLKRDGNSVEGRIERLGYTVATIRTELENAMEESPIKPGPNFLYKYLPAVDLSRGFDGKVFLIRQQNELETQSFEMGPGEITFGNSPHDTWREITVKKVISAFYMVNNIYLRPGAVVGEADPEAFLPYSFIMTDFCGDFKGD